MPEFCLKQVWQCDPVAERVINILTTETDNALTFTKGSQPLRCDSLPAYKLALRPGRHIAGLSIKIC